MGFDGVGAGEWGCSGLGHEGRIFGKLVTGGGVFGNWKRGMGFYAIGIPGAEFLRNWDLGLSFYGIGAPGVSFYAIGTWG